MTIAPGAIGLAGPLQATYDPMSTPPTAAMVAEGVTIPALGALWAAQLVGDPGVPTWVRAGGDGAALPEGSDVENTLHFYDGEWRARSDVQTTYYGLVASGGGFQDRLLAGLQAAIRAGAALNDPAYLIRTVTQGAFSFNYQGDEFVDHRSDTTMLTDFWPAQGPPPTVAVFCPAWTGWADEHDSVDAEIALDNLGQNDGRQYQSTNLTNWVRNPNFCRISGVLYDMNTLAIPGTVTRPTPGRVNRSWLKVNYTSPRQAAFTVTREPTE